MISEASSQVPNADRNALPVDFRVRLRSQIVSIRRYQLIVTSMMTSAVNPVMSSYATGAYDDATGRTIIAMLSRYLPYLPEVANMKMVTDTGALVGQLAPKMDKELGVISQRARRQ